MTKALSLNGSAILQFRLEIHSGSRLRVPGINDSVDGVNGVIYTAQGVAESPHLLLPEPERALPSKGSLRIEG
jgi:hypothetical protein